MTIAAVINSASVLENFMAKLVNATAKVVNRASVIVNCTSKVKNSPLRKVNSQSQSLSFASIYILFLTFIKCIPFASKQKIPLISGIFFGGEWGIRMTR
jgi:hypothetical protein